MKCPKCFKKMKIDYNKIELSFIVFVFVYAIIYFIYQTILNIHIIYHDIMGKLDSSFDNIISFRAIEIIYLINELLPIMITLSICLFMIRELW